MDDLAAVSGYSSETTGLPSKLHENAQAMFRSEVEYWRSFGKIVDSLEAGKKLSMAALAGWRAALQDMHFAEHVYSSSLDDATFARNLQMQVMSQQRQEFKAELKHVTWWE